VKPHDVIVIGAGSVGLPTSLFLAREGLRVLVIDRLPSPGQGQNKAAIGGIRATHSDPAKIQTCRLSLEVFSSWRETFGDDIHWQMGGYCFPVYDEADERALRDLLVVQKKHGLNIDWLGRKEVMELLPGINPEGLRGGTYSPEDGNVSPIMAARAMYRRASEEGAEFRMGEEVISIENEGGSARVITDAGSYSAGKVLNAAGARAREVGRLVGIDLPVQPDSHEAGVTEPVRKFFDPLVVDIRPYPGSKNFYFYQEPGGHVVFCLTPEPIIPGVNRDSTSTFLPQAARRLIDLFPRFRNLRVRRVWRGLYPMTPDGVPIVDRVGGGDVHFVAAGFCGQGLMLGPGIARNLVSLMTEGRPLISPDVFASFSLDRDFTRPSEALK
jgi:sarcosine oxidase subunit beta